MIDYIDAVVPMQNNGLIRDGYKTIIKGDGTRKKVNFWKKVPGRNGSSVKLRSIDKKRVQIIGNPAKFIQGQNVYGSDDLAALGCKLFADIAKQLKIKPTKKNRRQWARGDFDIRTLDVTYNFVLPSQSTVCEWLNKAAVSLGSGKQLITLHRASSVSYFESLYLGKSSHYIGVKFYNKYLQMIKEKKKRGEPNADPVLDELVKSSKGLLRCEMRFYHDYLKKHGLTKAGVLTPEVLQDHFKAKLERMHLGSSKILPAKDLEGLNNSQRLAYQLWLKGGDVKGGMKPLTFERICKKLAGLGVNIRIPLVEQVEGKSLQYYLKWGNMAQVPDFLIGSPWYFCPSKKTKVKELDDPLA
jgi:II/X family phage/plasmid replication protein